MEKIGKFGDRLRMIMNQEKLSVRKMADKSGVSPGAILDYINKDREPKLQFFHEFNKSFPQINLSWLITGTGNMYVNDGYITELETKINNIEEQLVVYKRLANAIEKIDKLETKGSDNR